MKANMIIVRGLDGREIVGENFDDIQTRVYRELPPKRLPNGRISESHYDLVLLIPGRTPHKSPAIFWRGCNALAITPEASVILTAPPEPERPREFWGRCPAWTFLARGGMTS